MRLTAIAHHLMPFAAVAGGILVLLMPRLLNYVVAIYPGRLHRAQQPFSLLPLTSLRRAWRWMRVAQSRGGPILQQIARQRYST